MKTSMKRNTAGFTLVEALVVGLIAAVLAAIAIPIYTGYVRDSRVKAAENTAGSAASACGAIRAFDSTEVPDGDFCSAHGATAAITVQGMSGPDSTIMTVPDGFTVAIDRSAHTVVCFYTSDPAVTSKTHSF